MALNGANSTAHSRASHDLSSRKYIKWDDPCVEKIPPGEEEDILAVAEQINAIQRAQFNMHRHCYGGTHARTQGVVKGELIVEDDLPAHLKQSMFSKGGRYPMVMRYSSEPRDPALDDRIPQPRGCGIKVFNVQGEFLPAGAGFDTQDFEFNSTPALDLADAKTSREIIALRIKYGSNRAELNKHLEARKDVALQKARDQVRNTHLESTRQYSQTAYRFGAYVAKFSLVPSSKTQRKLYDETVQPDSHTEHVLSDWLRAFHRDHVAEYQLQFQLLEDIAEQPVEDVGVVWDADKYPWQTVARVVVPPQDSFLPARKTFWEDHLRLDPWHGLTTLQPLGGSNRLRKIVYPRSSALRRKMNGRREIHVRSIEQIPDGEYVEGV